jgi:hypothetical protein
MPLDGRRATGTRETRGAFGGGCRSCDCGGGAAFMLSPVYDNGSLVVFDKAQSLSSIYMRAVRC